MAKDRVGERCDGDGVTVQASRWIKAPCGSDLLGQVGLLKIDYWNGSAKVTATLWIDSTGDLRIVARHPTAAELAGTTTAIGTVIGTQA